MKVAIIPARGGSKRIPRKNIKSFCGRPIISYSIQAAIESNLFDLIIVSTDDVEIAKLSVEYGASVPFIRPTRFSDDFTTTRDVIKHAISWLVDNEFEVEFCCCIYATAPFLKADDLIKSYKMISDSSKSFCFSATSFPFPIQRAFYFSDAGAVTMFDDSFMKARSQDLKEAYHDAGQFYWGRKSSFLSNADMLSEHSLVYILPRYRVQDIDNYEDWETAEIIFKSLENRAGDSCT